MSSQLCGRIYASLFIRKHGFGSTIALIKMLWSQESEESLKEVEGRTRELKECNQRLEAHVQVRLTLVSCNGRSAKHGDEKRPFQSPTMSHYQGSD